MNRILCRLALVLVCTLPLTALGGQDTPKKGKADPDRIQGMKDALADIEKGLLKFEKVTPRCHRYYWLYEELARKECGIDIVGVSGWRFPDRPHADRVAYNAVMLLEIEHRFGKDILHKLDVKAHELFMKDRYHAKPTADLTPQGSAEKGTADPASFRG